MMAMELWGSSLEAPWPPPSSTPAYGWSYLEEQVFIFLDLFVLHSFIICLLSTILRFPIGQVWGWRGKQQEQVFAATTSTLTGASSPSAPPCWSGRSCVHCAGWRTPATTIPLHLSQWTMTCVWMAVAMVARQGSHFWNINDRAPPYPLLLWAVVKYKF